LVQKIVTRGLAHFREIWRLDIHADNSSGGMLVFLCEWKGKFKI